MVCDTFAQLEEKEMSDSLPTPVTLIYSICNVIVLKTIIFFKIPKKLT